jgi:hypothetical protein
MIKERFLNKPRKKWLAKYFNGVSLIASAGVVSETFVKLGSAWRSALVMVLAGSFALGLFFAKADSDAHGED